MALPAIIPEMGITCIGVNSMEPVNTSTASVSTAPVVMAINDVTNACSMYLLRFLAL